MPGGEIDKDILLAALFELPQEQRIVIEQHDIWGHPREAVADELGIPVEEVHSHLMKGRVALKNAVFSN